MRPQATQRGFTLLEVLVATLIMGIAIAGTLSGIATAARNASRLSQYDRATLLAHQKMDELLVDADAPHRTPLDGLWSPAQSGGVPAGWHAVISPFEAPPGFGPGLPDVERVELEIWWMDGAVRHQFALEGFRRGRIRPGDY